MRDFDVQKVVEAAARAEWAVVLPGIPYAEQMGRFEVGTRAALAVIVPAVTKEVRALHRPVSLIFSWRDGVRMEERCETCQGKAGVWECGCWAEYDTNFYCAECSSVIDPHRVPHPCPTVDLCDALDAAARGDLS